MSLRDRLRALLFFTPWLTIPLCGLAAFTLVWLPFAVLVGGSWYPYGVLGFAVLAAVAAAVWLRPRYRIVILDVSHLGVVYWLQRRS